LQRNLGTCPSRYPYVSREWITLNLASVDTSLKASLKGKRKYAAWDNDFMAMLMAG
jgi:hypothetical protein